MRIGILAVDSELERQPLVLISSGGCRQARSRGLPDYDLRGAESGEPFYRVATSILDPRSASSLF
jgi:hypothetical protein